jgi:hypothetical protein
MENKWTNSDDVKRDKEDKHMNISFMGRFPRRA